MAKTKPMKTALSSGQKKLAALGVQLPQFPLTTVGSFPKNLELRELRYKVEKGVQPPSELVRKEKMATELWIRQQEKLGLDVMVDGEIKRGDFIRYFSKHIQGFSPGGTVRSYGNRYYQKPVITGKIAYKGPICLETWQSAQRMTHHVLKAIITGPYTLLDWSFNEFYSSREAALEDLTKVLRKELEHLVNNGAKIIQIDEPAISSRPEEFSLVAAALKELTAGLRSYFILHHSYGNLEPIWAKMQRLPVDNFDLECANSNMSFLSLLKKVPTTKDLTIGIIDSHSRLVETPRQVSERVKLALKSVPPNQLWFSPDCGLKTRSVEETVDKLKIMTQVVTKLRKTGKRPKK